MWRSSAADISGSARKPGMPRARLLAPHSAASRDITVKMVVPMSCKREAMRFGTGMLRSTVKTG
jgi:hypothetical protein